MVSVLEWYQLDISCNLTKEIHLINATCTILNICVIVIINLVLYLLLNRLWITMVVSEIVWTMIGLINYYVIRYHGMPFTITEFKNLNTALNVLKSYDLEIDIIPVKILATCGCVILYFFIERKKEQIQMGAFHEEFSKNTEIPQSMVPREDTPV